MTTTSILIWGNGPLACSLAQLASDDPTLNLIAVLAMTEDPQIQPANCVVITQPPEDGETTLLNLLEQGRRVICAVPQGVFQPDQQQVRDACKKGTSAFHQTSLFPQMLTERFAMTLSKGMEKVKHLRVVQSIDAGHVDSSLWGGLSASGLNGSKKALESQLQNREPAARAIACNIAGQLFNAPPETVRITARCNGRTTRSALALPFARIQKGRVSRCSYQHDAWLGEHHFLTLEEHWHCGEAEQDNSDAMPYGNVIGPCAFGVQIDGHPGRFDSQLQLTTAGDDNPLLAISAQEILHLIPALTEATPGLQLNDATPRYQLDSRMPSGRRAKATASVATPPLRVVIWGPGEIGGAVIRGALQRDYIQLVGAKVFSPHKHGKDIGELAGVAPIGVGATRSTADILALKPDCVIVTPQPRAITEGLDNDVITLLEAGINVITSAAYHNVTMPNWLAQAQSPSTLLSAVANTTGMGQNRAEDLLFAANAAITPRLTRGRVGKLITPLLDKLLDAQVRKAMPYRATPAQLQAACEKGQATLHGTGVHPTFMAERIGMQLAGMLPDVRHVRFIEAADFSYMPDGMWGGLSSLGFGRPVEQLNKHFLIAKAGDFYYGDVIGNAAHLMYGVPCSQVRVEREFRGLAAKRAFQVGSLRIRKGHAAALHMIHKGYIGDHHFFTNEECWYLGPECEFRGANLPFGNFTTPLSYTIQASSKKQSVDMQLSMDGTGKAAEMMAGADTSTAAGRCQLGQQYREAGVTNPITNATAMAILDALPAVCAMPAGVVIDDVSPGFRAL